MWGEAWHGGGPLGLSGGLFLAWGTGVLIIGAGIMCSGHRALQVGARCLAALLASEVWSAACYPLAEILESRNPQIARRLHVE